MLDRNDFFTKYESEFIDYLRDKGYDVRLPNRTTVRRRLNKADGNLILPLIARNLRTRQASDGKFYRYSKLPEEDQRKLDQGPWYAGADVRAQLQPLVATEAMTVINVYEVLGWEPANDGSKRWIPSLGRRLQTEEIRRRWPNFPFHPGGRSDGTRMGGAYRPYRYSSKSENVRAS